MEGGFDPLRESFRREETSVVNFSGPSNCFPVVDLSQTKPERLDSPEDSSCLLAVFVSP